MRTKKELGQILLDNQDLFLITNSAYTGGLCPWIIELMYAHKITNEEKDKLKEIIYNNRPKKTMYNYIYNPDKIKDNDAAYFWEKGFITPRIKWINKHLINA